MQLNVAGAFTYFVIPIFGGIPITQTTVSSLIASLLLIVFSIVLGKKLKTHPDGKQVLLEKGVMMLKNMVVETMGEHNLNWLPFIGTVFLSSITYTFIGLTGFLRSATADLSCTLTWALMVSVLIWVNSIKANGVLGWLKGYTEPIAVMTPMNLISEIAQPVSMAFRHFGNVAGGGVITSILYLALSSLSSLVLNAIAANGIVLCAALLFIGAGLLVLFKLRAHKKRVLVLGCLSVVLGVFGLLQTIGLVSDIPVLTFGIPAVLSCYFDIFSGFVQAYVFTLLTMVYIGNACPPPEEGKAAQ